jgi:hypothetical protein
MGQSYNNDEIGYLYLYELFLERVGLSNIL